MKRAYPEWIGEAGDRAARPKSGGSCIPIEFDETLARQGRRGSSRPVAGGRAHLPGVHLRRGRPEPRRGARSHAGDPGHRPQAGPRPPGPLPQARRSTTPAPASTSAPATCARCRPLRRAAWSGSWRPTTRGRTAWTPGRRRGPDMSAEEFIESIPFTETRHYVMIVLANREQYRRLYGLDSPAPAAPSPRAQRP